MGIENRAVYLEQSEMMMWGGEVKVPYNMNNLMMFVCEPEGRRKGKG